MTPNPQPHDLDSLHDVVWYIKYLWHMVAGGTSVVVAFIGFLFREAIKQMLIDKIISRFKKGGTKIEKEVKKEFHNDGPNTDAAGDKPAGSSTSARNK